MCCSCNALLLTPSIHNAVNLFWEWSVYDFSSFSSWRIADKFHSMSYRQDSWITDNDWRLFKTNLTEWETKCSGYESLTFCSQVKRALRDPIIWSFSISPRFFLSPVLVFQSFYRSGDPWVLAPSMIYCSHPSVYFKVHLLSSQPHVSQEVAGQTGAESYLSVICSVSTYRFTDLSLSQKRAFSYPPTKVYKKSRTTGQSLFPLRAKSIILEEHHLLSGWQLPFSCILMWSICVWCTGDPDPGVHGLLNCFLLCLLKFRQWIVWAEE